MKQLIVALLIILLGSVAIVTFKEKPVSSSSTPSQVRKSTPTVMPTQTSGSRSAWLFVPYWGISHKPIDTAGYDKIVYFGIVPTATGIDTKEDGYLAVKSFIKNTPKAEKYLTVRMLNTDINTKVLADTALQETIATEAAQIAKENGFQGIVLDFEHNALSFDSVVGTISNLYTTFAKATHKENLSFYAALYGDVVYRARPYDISKIAKLTDGILVMTYDFHKAGGDPGPNFPLSGKETYGYDISVLATDFLKTSTPKHITFVFGMFGYDWTVDEKNRTEKQGVPITLLETQQKFKTPCILLHCTVKRDNQSGETQVLYTDASGQKHEAWFEDMDSVKTKEAFLEKKGINSFGFWAYSYF